MLNLHPVPLVAILITFPIPNTSVLHFRDLRFPSWPCSSRQQRKQYDQGRIQDFGIEAQVERRRCDYRAAVGVEGDISAHYIQHLWKLEGG